MGGSGCPHKKKKLAAIKLSYYKTFHFYLDWAKNNCRHSQGRNKKSD